MKLSARLVIVIAAAAVVVLGGAYFYVFRAIVPGGGGGGGIVASRQPSMGTPAAVAPRGRSPMLTAAAVPLTLRRSGASVSAAIGGGGAGGVAGGVGSLSATAFAAL